MEWGPTGWADAPKVVHKILPLSVDSYGTNLTSYDEIDYYFPIHIWTLCAGHVAITIFY